MKKIFLLIFLLSAMSGGFAHSQEEVKEPAEQEYDDGTPKVVETYYENGSLKSKGVYRWGRKNGVFREYYQSGQIKSVSSYNQDMLVTQETFESLTPEGERDDIGVDKGLKVKESVKPEEQANDDAKNEVKLSIDPNGEPSQEVKDTEAVDQEESVTKKGKSKKSKTDSYTSKYNKDSNIGIKSEPYNKKKGNKYSSDSIKKVGKYKKKDYKFKNKEIKKYKKKKFTNSKPPGVY